MCGPEGADGYWEPDQLRSELLEALELGGIETTDFAEALDPDGNGKIKKKEVLHLLKRIVNDEMMCAAAKDRTRRANAMSTRDERVTRCLAGGPKGGRTD